MKNKRGWLRIFEAVVGVLIVFGFLLYFITQEKVNKNISEDIYEKQMKILEIISKNESLRSEILSENKTGINNFILKNIPNSWNFSVNICEINEICNREYTPYDREVYASEILITSNLTIYNPKKIRFFVWRK